ncbi:metalloregulator ArsR/SmtB family transcription factor [bacterium]|nr:metalloregulator ArsR/SmtB family transcription factor [bacterium]
MESKYVECARVFKALCDENRIAILEQLKAGERCACVLLKNLDIGQSTLSHHMKILCESGMVRCRQEGKWTYYSLSPEGRERAKRLLDEFTAPSPAAETDAAFAAAGEEALLCR